MNSSKVDAFFSRDQGCGEIGVVSDEKDYYELFCEELIKSKDIVSFKRRIISLVNDMGFTDFIFRRIDGGKRYHSVLMTMPEELIRVYAEENFYDGDLMIAYVKQNTQPIFTSQVYKYICDAPFETNMTTINRGIEKLYNRFGFFEFYSVPMKAYNGNGNVQFAIAQQGLNSDEFQHKIAPYQGRCRQLCKAIDYVSTVRFATFMTNDEGTRGISLSPKPLRILNRLANTDLTIAELANELCISPITAHQHIAVARKALGVKTNIGAIKKAVKLKLITFQ